MAATGNEVVKLSQLKTIYDDLASKIGVGGMEFGTQDDIFEDGTNISAIGIKINGIAFVSFSCWSQDGSPSFRLNSDWRGISNGLEELIGHGVVQYNHDNVGFCDNICIYKNPMGSSLYIYDTTGTIATHGCVSGTITYALRS